MVRPGSYERELASCVVGRQACEQRLASTAARLEASERKRASSELELDGCDMMVRTCRVHLEYSEECYEACEAKLSKATGKAEPYKSASTRATAKAGPYKGDQPSASPRLQERNEQPGSTSSFLQADLLAYKLDLDIVKKSVADLSQAIAEMQAALEIQEKDHMLSVEGAEEREEGPTEEEGPVASL